MGDAVQLMQAGHEVGCEDSIGEVGPGLGGSGEPG